MELLVRLWHGREGVALRRLRPWLADRGYARVATTREGVGRSEEFSNGRLGLVIYVDRTTDWYVDLKPVAAAVGWRQIDEWLRCTGAHLDPTTKLESQLDALRAHLARFEAACEPNNLEATIACLG